MSHTFRQSSLEHSTAQMLSQARAQVARKTTHAEPFTADETLWTMDTELATHPDCHDGWSSMRPREVALDTPMQAAEGQRVLTVGDRARVNELLTRYLEEEAFQAHVEKLKLELRDAKVVCPTRISPRVVTMNSMVVYEDVREGTRNAVRLVYPGQAPATSGHLSVLHPLGGALLGRSQGQHAEYSDQTGRFRILEVPYQPEAAGYLHA